MAPPGKRDLLRYREVRRADVLDDQKSALDILAANTTLTQEQLQELILSQLKRVIWGTRPGHWNDDFATNGLSSLADLSRGTPLFVAMCASNDGVGDMIYVPGPSIGGIPRVTRIDVTDINKMPAIGIIIDKTTPTLCHVQTLGMVEATALIPGKRYFAGLNGRPSPSPPVPTSDGHVFMQPIGLAIDTTTLLLMPSLALTKHYV